MENKMKVVKFEVKEMRIMANSEEEAKEAMRQWLLETLEENANFMKSQYMVVKED